MNPNLRIYAVTALVLSLNILWLWTKSGFVRGRTKTVMNDEDRGAAAKGVAVVEMDPPEVRRVLRAHRNALDNSVPFLVVALVFVLLGASPLAAGITFCAFVLARLLHSFAYLRAIQPMRTIAFVSGLLVTVVLIGWNAVLLIRGA
jgi:prostaglandin-E synthase 1